MEKVKKFLNIIVKVGAFANAIGGVAIAVISAIDAAKALKKEVSEKKSQQ